ncbi:hypothetical protein ACB092_01G285400 [Castanea dentata]
MKHILEHKERYWKLSLLVHRDKCPYPQAHQTFIKLNKSFKELQDPNKCVASHPDTRMLFLNCNLFICESNILKNKDHIMTI